MHHTPLLIIHLCTLVQFIFIGTSQETPGRSANVWHAFFFYPFLTLYGGHLVDGSAKFLWRIETSFRGPLSNSVDITALRPHVMTQEVILPQ